MEDINDENILNFEYKEKYLKYKNKYLKLKKKIKSNDEIDGGSWGTLASSALNFAKSNPNLTDGLSNIALIGFKTFLSQSPEYQKLVRSGLITPQNSDLMFQLIKLEISHLADPTFYPIMLRLIKNILILFGSAETLNPITIITSLKDLYSILNELKLKYPQDFILISTFLYTNKNSILNLIGKISSYNPVMRTQLEMQLNIFMKLIAVPNQQNPTYQMYPTYPTNPTNLTNQIY